MFTLPSSCSVSFPDQPGNSELDYRVGRFTTRVLQIQIILQRQRRRTPTSDSRWAVPRVDQKRHHQTLPRVPQWAKILAHPPIASNALPFTSRVRRRRDRPSTLARPREASTARPYSCPSARTVRLRRENPAAPGIRWHWPRETNVLP